MLNSVVLKYSHISLLEPINTFLKPIQDNKKDVYKVETNKDNGVDKSWGSEDGRKGTKQIWSLKRNSSKSGKGEVLVKKGKE